MKDYQSIIGELSPNVIGTLTRADNGTLDKKEQQAIDLIRAIYKQRGIVWLAYSGGKDSEVLYHLCKKANVEFSGYYNNTTIDPPGTIPWVKRHEEIMIMQPRRSFYTLIEHRGMPCRRHRFCCEKLKERYTVPHFINGIRAAESKRRAEQYKEVEKCWVYKHGQTAQTYMPLLYWSNQDIESYINNEGIKCHPLYYDTNGKFCVNRRLGCLGCPLPYDRGKHDFVKYPRMVRAWCRAEAIYRNTRPTLTSIVTNFTDEYECFYFHLFLDNLHQLQERRNGLFEFNPRKMLSDYFKIELPPAQSTLTEMRKRIPNAAANQ